MVVTMVHTDRVNLFFITLDTVWGSNVVSEKPSLSWVLGSFDGVDDDFVKNSVNSSVLFSAQNNTYFAVIRAPEEIPSEVYGGWENTAF